VMEEKGVVVFYRVVNWVWVLLGVGVWLSPYRLFGTNFSLSPRLFFLTIYVDYIKKTHTNATHSRTNGRTDTHADKHTDKQTHPGVQLGCEVCSAIDCVR